MDSNLPKEAKTKSHRVVTNKRTDVKGSGNKTLSDNRSLEGASAISPENGNLETMKKKSTKSAVRDPKVLKVIKKYASLETSNPEPDMYKSDLKRMSSEEQSLQWKPKEETLLLHEQYLKEFVLDNDNTCTDLDTDGECPRCCMGNLDRKTKEISGRQKSAFDLQSKVTKFNMFAAATLRTYESERTYLMNCSDKLLTSSDAYKKLAVETVNVGLTAYYRYGELRATNNQQKQRWQNVESGKKGLKLRNMKLEVQRGSLEQCRNKYSKEVDDIKVEASSLLNCSFNDHSLESILKVVDEKSAELEAKMKELGLGLN